MRRSQNLVSNQKAYTNLKLLSNVRKHPRFGESDALTNFVDVNQKIDSSHTYRFSHSEISQVLADLSNANVQVIHLQTRKLESFAVSSWKIDGMLLDVKMFVMSMFPMIERQFEYTSRHSFLVDAIVAFIFSVPRSAKSSDYEKYGIGVEWTSEQYKKIAVLLDGAGLKGVSRPVLVWGEMWQFVTRLAFLYFASLGFSGDKTDSVRNTRMATMFKFSDNFASIQKFVVSYSNLNYRDFGWSEFLYRILSDHGYYNAVSYVNGKWSLVSFTMPDCSFFIWPTMILDWAIYLDVEYTLEDLMLLVRFYIWLVNAETQMGLGIVTMQGDWLGKQFIPIFSLLGYRIYPGGGLMNSISDYNRPFPILPIMPPWRVLRIANRVSKYGLLSDTPQRSRIYCDFGLEPSFGTDGYLSIIFKRLTELSEIKHKESYNFGCVDPWGLGFWVPLTYKGDGKLVVAQAAHFFHMIYNRPMLFWLSQYFTSGNDKGSYIYPVQPAMTNFFDIGIMDMRKLSSVDDKISELFSWGNFFPEISVEVMIKSIEAQISSYKVITSYYVTNEIALIKSWRNSKIHQMAVSRYDLYCALYYRLYTPLYDDKFNTLVRCFYPQMWRFGIADNEVIWHFGGEALQFLLIYAKFFYSTHDVPDSKIDIYKRLGIQLVRDGREIKTVGVTESDMKIAVLGLCFIFHKTYDLPAIWGSYRFELVSGIDGTDFAYFKATNLISSAKELNTFAQYILGVDYNERYLKEFNETKQF